MPASAIYLHGGGDQAESRGATFGRFVQALDPEAAGPLLVVVAEASEADRAEAFLAYSAILHAAEFNTDRVVPAFVGPEQPLTREHLDAVRPCGVFVCGGMTPYYHKSLCADPGWTAYLREAQIPYCGTSAGAAIAADQAILGGWQAERGGRRRGIVFPGAGEGLEQLTVQPGLGLAPFAVDVHASQWGTLLRLVHAVDLGLVERGWAIDEDTLLEVRNGDVGVFGRGHAYWVERVAGRATVRIVHA
jgi:cyanophycinase